MGSPVHVQYRSLASRQKSFWSWPISLKVRPDKLSNAGFFYTGVGDETVCYHCGIILSDWMDSDDPWIEHAKWSPTCSYIEFLKGREFVDKVIGDVKHRAMFMISKSMKIPGAVDKQLDIRSSDHPIASTRSAHETTVENFQHQEETGSKTSGSDESAASNRSRACGVAGALDEAHAFDKALGEAGASDESDALDSLGATDESSASDKSGAWDSSCAVEESSMSDESGAWDSSCATEESVESDESGALCSSCATLESSELDELGALGEEGESDASSGPNGSGGCDVSGGSNGTVQKDGLLIGRKRCSDQCSEFRVNVKSSRPEHFYGKKRKLTESKCINEVHGIGTSVSSDNEGGASTSGADIIKENKHCLCQICSLEKLSIVFLPCGHLIACEKCSSFMEKCIVCKSEYTATLRVHIP